MPLCNPQDLYQFGVPRGSAPNPGRVLAAVADDTLTLDVHGFYDNDPVIFRPAGAAAMPAGLVAGVTYYVLEVSEQAFKVRAEPDGAALTFDDTDDPIMVISPLPVADAILWAEHLCYDMLPAHVVPIADADPVPEILRVTCAELAAWKLLAIMGASSVSLSDTLKETRRRLERWAQGVPLRGEDAPARANLAAPAVAPYTDRRGWSRFGGV